MFKLLKREMLANPVRKAGALLCKPGFQAVRAVTSADEYGGSPLLGVDGICIIAHGGSSPIAVKNALRAACTSIQHQLNPHIVEAVQRSHDSAKKAPQPA
jgi:glycerol-3-phosphate acyltransferase PlsX